ncbi:MAG: hypothetical protein Q7T84_02425 [Phenylobacterium sp.]|uniref:hypothetical protein n=1 Tax=Phenylobacterium sp. TaxID=1871053 RepID=UPI0027210FEA|nr:hypothetical protein [Phenylobacterium sp.]MDO9430135.1 hypothetical protein [Phenylobacterium sp.]
MKALKRPAARVCTFRAGLRGGVWQVTRDYVFHGEYPTREDAAEGACNAARTLEASGGAARVLATPGDTLIPHQSPRAKP